MENEHAVSRSICTYVQYVTEAGVLNMGIVQHGCLHGLCIHMYICMHIQ